MTGEGAVHMEEKDSIAQVVALHCEQREIQSVENKGPSQLCPYSSSILVHVALHMLRRGDRSI